MHRTATSLFTRRRLQRAEPRHGRDRAPAPAGVPRRRIDPPTDEALFTCSCGFAWTGAVTTSVDCPHCATPQAW